MSVIYVLLTISIVVAVFFFIAFIISVRNGQYDDSYTPSVRMLFEDELVKTRPSEEKRKKSSLPAGGEGLRGTKQTVCSKLKETDCRATRAMTGNKKRIQLNKQE